MGAADFAWADGLRRAHFPPERNRLPAHLTLFHHLPPSVEAELLRRLAALCASPPPPARLAGFIDLDGGVALRIESPALMAMRDELASAFAGMLTPQDRATPRLHVTIQNKVPPVRARTLQAALEKGFRPRPFMIAGLAAWRYMGGPWLPIRAMPFRG
ncbi:2'-5' RNA ligase family protein [Sphingobium aquiterrae]|uniref:2'-5' RNA ligase family protein n=1 Tax=Sphingobium aquiterrae TaxID=2038656 RepID=UPI00301757DD